MAHKISISNVTMAQLKAIASKRNETVNDILRKIIAKQAEIYKVEVDRHLSTPGPKPKLVTINL